MDGLATTTTIAAAPAQRIGASWCEECGYHLRGLPPGQPCPECGHVPPELDGVVDGIVPPQVLRQYSTDPTLQPLLHINPSDAVRYISFNMAIPPFDDVHVRKALNLALDKAGMRTFRGGESVGEIAGHIMVNSL